MSKLYMNISAELCQNYFNHLKNLHTNNFLENVQTGKKCSDTWMGCKGLEKY